MPVYRVTIENREECKMSYALVEARTEFDATRYIKEDREDMNLPIVGYRLSAELLFQGIQYYGEYEATLLVNS